MTSDEKTVDDQPEDLLEMARRVRRERDERLVEIRAKKSTLQVEPHPGLKRLVDTNDEFYESVMTRIDRIIASARRF